MPLAINREYQDLLDEAKEKLEAVGLMVGDTLGSAKSNIKDKDLFIVKTLLSTLSSMLESCVGVASAVHEFINE